MKSLQEDIKNQDFKKVYLFCGEEAYLKQQYKHRMKAALLPEKRQHEFFHVRGKEDRAEECDRSGGDHAFFC